MAQGRGGRAPAVRPDFPRPADLLQQQAHGRHPRCAARSPGAHRSLHGAACARRQAGVLQQRAEVQVGRGDRPVVQDDRHLARHVAEGFRAQSAHPSVFRTGVSQMIKKGSAVWKGSLKEGGGTISTETGVLKNAPYGFKARFEDGPGTNPEELIGAAHAACFSMALSAGLGKAGFTADSIQTEAAVRLEKVGDGFAITHSDLVCLAKIPGIDDKTFMEIAEQTKSGCPVSKVLNAKISLSAKLSQ